MVMNFEGHLTKVGRIWYYQMWIKGQGLKRKSTGEANRRRAEAKARKINQQWQLLSTQPEELPRLSTAAVKEVLRLAEEVSAAQATRAEYAYKAFLRWAGREDRRWDGCDVALEDIDTDALNTYQKHRIKNCARDTVNKELNFMVRLLDENGYQVKKPKLLPGEETEVMPFNADQAKKFFEACACFPKDEPGKYTPLFATLLVTGARPAELVPSPRSTHVPLLKSEVDYERAVITIRSAKQRGQSRGPVRQIVVCLDLLEMIKDAAAKTPNRFVFGGLYKMANTFNAIMNLAEIERRDDLLKRKFTAHSFRHTYATMMAEKVGGDPFALKTILGHKKIETTDRYVNSPGTAEVIEIAPFLVSPKKQKAESDA